MSHITQLDKEEFDRIIATVKDLVAVVDDFMPNIGKCSLQNYRRLNEAPITGRQIVEKYDT